MFQNNIQKCINEKAFDIGNESKSFNLIDEVDLEKE